MTKKCIKVPFVEEVTGKPGAMVQFVEQTTTPLDSTVQAAVDGLYVIGNAQLVKNTFLGLFRSMVAGVQRDGKPRKIADFIRAYPVLTGAIDLDKGFDPKENGVYLAVELLNEMKLDTSKWTFEDVTEGRKQVTIESVKGTEMGVVNAGKRAEINGHNLSGEHVVELQLEGGEVIRVDPKNVTGDISRLDIARAAFAPFRDLANDGKELTIIVRGNFAKATRKVTLAVTPPPCPEIVKVHSEIYDTDDGTWARFAETLHCETKDELPDDAVFSVRLYDRSNGAEVTRIKWNDDLNKVTITGEKTFDLKLFANNSAETDSTWLDEEYEAKIVIESSAGNCEFPLYPREY